MLDSADVICTTTTIDEELLGDWKFDLVVMDEACQCTEPQCGRGLCETTDICRDHCQLPPTVVSTEAARDGLGRSLMERLVTHFGEPIFRRLTVQYRMHQAIMTFPESTFL